MPLTVDQDILYPALRLARVTGGPGRTPSPDQVSDAFQSLNRMVDSWNILQGLIHLMERHEYTLTPAKPVYTIGRAAGADFVADNPTRIDHANIIIGTGGSKVYTHMRILDAREWAATAVRDFTTTVPTAMYPDYAEPNCALYMWGTPTGSPGLELWTWVQADQFVSETDPVIVPAGYLDAMVYSLAVRMGSTFGTTSQMDPMTFQTATKALAKVKGFNQPSPMIASADFGTRSGTRGGWNYMTGGPA